MGYNELYVVVNKNNQKPFNALSSALVKRLGKIVSAYEKQDGVQKCLSQYSTSIINQTVMKHTDSIVICCPEDPDHFMLNAIEPDQILSHPLSEWIRFIYDSESGFSKEQYAIDIQDFILCDHEVCDLLESKCMTSIDESQFKRASINSIDQYISLLSQSHHHSNTDKAIEVIVLSFTSPKDNSQFSVTYIDIPRDILCDDSFLCHEAVSLIDSFQDGSQDGLLSQYLWLSKPLRFVYLFVDCNENDITALTKREEGEKENHHHQNADSVLLEMVNTSKVQELVKRILSLKEEIERIESEHSRMLSDQVDMKKEMLQVGICESTSLKEMILSLITKFKELKAMNEELTVYQKVLSSYSNTSLTEVPSVSIQSILEEAMKCVDSLEGSSIQSAKELSQKHVEYLEKQVKEYETRCIENGKKMSEYEDYKRKWEESERLLKKKGEELSELQTKEIKMKKDMSAVYSQLMNYVNNMKVMKKHIDKDQQMIIDMEVYLSTLQEEVSSLLQMKTTLKQLCESIIQKLNGCAYTYGVYPEFYQLQVLVEDLDAVLKESGERRIPEVSQSKEEDLVMMVPKETPSNTEFYHAVDRYYVLYKHLVDTQYDLKVTEEMIDQLTDQYNDLCREEKEKEQQKEELRSLVTHLKEEIVVIAEDVVNERNRIDELDGEDHDVQEEKVVSFINRLSYIDSMIHERKQQIGSLETRLVSINQSLTIKKQQLSQMVKKRTVQMKQIESMKERLWNEQKQLLQLKKQKDITKKQMHESAMNDVEDDQNGASSMIKKSSLVGLLPDSTQTDLQKVSDSLKNALEMMNSARRDYQHYYQESITIQKQYMNVSHNIEKLRQQFYSLPNENGSEDIKNKIAEYEEEVEALQKQSDKMMEIGTEHYGSYCTWKIKVSQLSKKQLQLWMATSSSQELIEEEIQRQDTILQLLDKCQEVVRSQFTKEGDSIQQDGNVQMQPVNDELNVVLSEKKKVENELKTLSEMKKVNLIDEYKDEYDHIVAEIKQLDTQYLVSGQQNEEEYKKKRMELNQKKTDYNRLFEEQMQRDENLPSHIEHLEERLKALNFQIDNLQMEVEDERHVVNYHMDFNKKTGDSLISCLDDCKTEVKQYAERIASNHLDDLHLDSFVLEENTEYFSELHKSASFTPVPSVVYHIQSTEEILGEEKTDLSNGLEDSEEHSTIPDGMVATEEPSQATEVSRVYPGRWMEDNESSSCLVCGKSFSLFRRRHHCRKCGMLVCSACSSSRLQLTEIGYKTPVRVCDKCK